MTATDEVRAARTEATARLLELAYGPGHGYDVAAVMERALPVVVRDAWCTAHTPGAPGRTCGRCGRPSGGPNHTGIIDEANELHALARGDIGSILDALGGATIEAATVTTDVGGLLDALDTYGGSAP